MGKKHLFIRNRAGTFAEINPYCCLDFYVHEWCQRLGIDHSLFEKCIEVDGIQPHRMGYDRPSPKLIAFLRKHFGLVSYVP
ncbi:putative Alpha-tubulin N-acetyltransferase [Monocercomonoides exilis]|uniref:putative Alpha-tubulin N-acetyltransferase n=1 Tax=Monocercomonoides exilis TaxID=2049356 RepID=UPI0035596CE0|nr:putative Alpha-tubulin N-acetyltransferase [Monocercomonoides exilis]|eukprot:MONOS_13098.1-p1 / transcript=MONOS_13098.1 / gene=MONOS_13098 / organism=Monocercomonoides_exilis_PA203 / gene_product=Alpha-tubulin N-acetyltransferase / transcript_product=Alpha-tubulin N-acetyltransferase / location=Mono_scaffold00778:568-861(+) / protein_length=80 / sequence_SO=supercontig / SO=protein_coding / is_pseudo=false